MMKGPVLRLCLLFASGALAICAMILPGISGSFILLLLGMYKPVLDAIHYRDLGVIAVLMAGAVVGLLDRAELGDARIVDQGVDPAEAGGRGLDRRSHLIGLGLKRPQ